MKISGSIITKIKKKRKKKKKLLNYDDSTAIRRYSRYTVQQTAARKSYTFTIT